MGLLVGAETVGRFKEVKSLRRKAIPVARRVLGEGHDVTFRMRWAYAGALYMDEAATLDDLREAVTTLEDVGRTARRVFGSSHPETPRVQRALEDAREALARRAAASSSGAK